MLQQRKLSRAALLCFLSVLVASPSQAEGLLRGSVSKGVGKQSFSVPVIHHIGLWPHQDDFVVTDLKVIERDQMRESKPTASVQLQVEGTIRKGRRVKAFFVREQFRETASGKRIVEIVVIPVIEAETTRANAPNESAVVAAAEYTLHQYQWPDNNFVIVCGRQAREVTYVYP